MYLEGLESWLATRRGQSRRCFKVTMIYCGGYILSNLCTEAAVERLLSSDDATL